MQTKTKHIYSRWGKVQSETNITEGIDFIGTAGHGGFILSEEMNNKIPAEYRSNDLQYEEDCEWSIVVKFLPEYFNDPKEIKAANKIFERWIKSNK